MSGSSEHRANLQELRRLEKEWSVMLELKGTVCIDAPLERVWAALSQLDAIQNWVPAIKHSYCPGQSREVGALRICELKQATLRETIIEWDEGRMFRYSGEGAPMLKSASNRWSVTPHGKQTLVTTEATAELKGGFFGRLLEPLFRLLFARMGQQSLVTLKYYVEIGTPFRGKASTLPAPAIC